MSILEKVMTNFVGWIFLLFPIWFDILINLDSGRLSFAHVCPNPFLSHLLALALVSATPAQFSLVFATPAHFALVSATPAYYSLVSASPTHFFLVSASPTHLLLVSATPAYLSSASATSAHFFFRCVCINQLIWIFYLNIMYLYYHVVNFVNSLYRTFGYWYPDKLSKWYGECKRTLHIWYPAHFSLASAIPAQ